MRGTLAALLTLTLVGLSSAQAGCDYAQYIPVGQVFYISSPGYPDLYQRGVQCRWRATSPSNSKILLNCPVVEIPSTPTACVDSLIVSQTGDTSDGTVYCGTKNISVTSLGAKLTVELHSVYWSSRGRFTCSVRAVQNPDPLPPPDPNCQCGWSFRSRIVGGTETGVNEFPMMAGLVSSTLGRLICGATISSPRFAITAAHCLRTTTPETTALLVGDHDLTTGRETNATELIRVSRFHVHPEYDSQTWQNDIALVELVKPVTYGPRVGPACLPFRHPEDFVRESVTALGWGASEFAGSPSDTLQKVSVKVVPITECVRTFEDRIAQKKQMCTYAQGKDACQFDSGGPLLWLDPSSNRFMLVAVISFGRACGLAFPSVNTKVSSYNDFILNVTKGEQYCIK